MWREGISQQLRLKVKVTLEGQMFVPVFCVRQYLPNSFKDVHETWFKCSLYWDDVQKAWGSYNNLK